MADESVSATRVIHASAEAVFAVLVDPASHAAIDGTGWVCDPVDRQLLTSSGQTFRMAMFHPQHPNGNYEMANRIEVLDPPHHRLEARLRPGRRRPPVRGLDLAL